jgi:hypothetical protein
MVSEILNLGALHFFHQISGPSSILRFGSRSAQRKLKIIVLPDFDQLCQSAQRFCMHVVFQAAEGLVWQVAVVNTKQLFHRHTAVENPVTFHWHDSD